MTDPNCTTGAPDGEGVHLEDVRKVSVPERTDQDMKTPIYESIALVDVSYLFSYRWHPQAHKERNDAAPDTLAHIGRIRQRVGT